MTGVIAERTYDNSSVFEYSFPTTNILLASNRCVSVHSNFAAILWDILKVSKNTMGRINSTTLNVLLVHKAK